MEERKVAFLEVLETLESSGWVLYRISLPYRVFYFRGDPSTGLPILVEVHDGKWVLEEHVLRIRQILTDWKGQSGEKDNGRN